MNEKFIQSEDVEPLDSKEIELPETKYVRNIEPKIFQGIVIQCLSKIDGVSLIGSNIIDSLLGRDNEKIKGIHIVQDEKKPSISIKIEINIKYSVSIPEKAEEIQNKVAREITSYTGLHVSKVHVIFKNLIPENPEDIGTPETIKKNKLDSVFYKS